MMTFSPFPSPTYSTHIVLCAVRVAVSRYTMVSFVSTPSSLSPSLSLNRRLLVAIVRYIPWSFTIIMAWPHPYTYHTLIVYVAYDSNQHNDPLAIYEPAKSKFFRRKVMYNTVLHAVTNGDFIKTIDVSHMLMTAMRYITWYTKWYLSITILWYTNFSNINICTGMAIATIIIVSYICISLLYIVIIWAITNDMTQCNVSGERRPMMVWVWSGGNGCLLADRQSSVTHHMTISYTYHCLWLALHLFRSLCWSIFRWAP